MAATRTLRRRARNPWMRRLKRTAVFFGFVFGIAFIAAAVVYIPIYQEAQDDATNIERKLTVKDENPTVVYSADGKILYRVSTIRRKVIDLTEKKYPAYVRYAIVAAEDRRFYDHRGVDPIGLARAVYRRGAAGGGSTIPMQLAKNLINGDDRSLRRKLKDIATAQEIDQLKSKDEILNLYANSSYFGEQAYGIEQAALIYFNKTADKLTVGEAAMLARCVRLPSRVNPIKSPEKMIDLRNYVLGVMLEENWITQRQYDEGIREKPKLNRHPSNSKPLILPEAGYFVQHVLSQLDAQGIDYRSGGYQITTTLNLKLQHRAVQAVRDVLRDNRGHNVNDGAIVVMDQDGRVLAEVGGPDYAKRQFNVVTQGPHGRQPGSAFKAIVYATALKNGVIHPGDSLDNSRIHKKLSRNKWWDPQNGSRFEDSRSSWSLEEAFAYSINRPAIHTIEKVGPENVVAAASDVFGFKSKLEPVDSLALGTSEVRPVEMLEAYSVFMLGGNRVEPQTIAKVIDPDGKGVPDLAFQPRVHEKVLKPEIAQQMDAILKGPVEFGTAKFAQAVPNAHGKTGTTNEAKDAWFCGYSDGLVGVGWVGNTSKKGGRLPMSSSVFGGTVTVKIWTAVMLAAHDLNLAKGVRRNDAPRLDVSVQSSPEPEVKPLHEGPPDGPRNDRGVDKPEPDPVELVPAPPNDPTTKDPQPPATDPASTPDDPTPVAADPPANVPPKRRERPRPTDKTDDEVPVEVCVDTGLRASMYCPETVTRMFPRGRAPRKLCNLHHG